LQIGELDMHIRSPATSDELMRRLEKLIIDLVQAALFRGPFLKPSETRKRLLEAKKGDGA
jgi:hypothetical protein